MGENEIIVIPRAAIPPAGSPLAARAADLDPEQRLTQLWLKRLASRHTRRAYSRSLKQFRTFVPLPLIEIRLDELQAYTEHLETLPLRPGSRHAMLAAVKSFFAFAHELGLLPLDVSRPMKLPSGKDTLNERILSIEEVQRIIRACESTRDRLMALVLYYCGLRISELVSITFADLRPRSEGGQVTVLGKGNKTRTILVPAFLFAELEIEGARRKDRNEKVFPISTSQAHRIIRAAAAKAGIGKPVSPHWLRHCHCSHALERGADLALIQATAGHSNVATTSRYLHARPDRSSSSFLPPPA